jgi:hypothetical protein
LQFFGGKIKSMKNLMIISFCSFVLSVFGQTVFAAENCVTLKANKVGASVEIYREYAFGEHNFKDGQIELAISETRKKTLPDAAQVTFNRNTANASCFFTPIAFVQGGMREDYWGWHMMWAESSGGLFYARMDGEAWVSSPTKSLTKLTAINPQFSVHSQSIIVTWQQVENGATANMQAVSSDEGRSWEISPIQQ